MIRRECGIKWGVNAANEAAFHPEAERGIDTLRGDAERGRKILRCIRPPVMAQKPQHDLELISVRLLDISIYKRVRHGENRAPCAELQLITHEKPPFPILNSACIIVPHIARGYNRKPPGVDGFCPREIFFKRKFAIGVDFTEKIRYNNQRCKTQYADVAQWQSSSLVMNRLSVRF